ncbi:hypothetical protein [Pseudomonas sp. WHRI 8519]|uniref:hypothetical protein n=1 Tax=Pseudomonas sp. WHRI 8519 TaxID=3162567 RepID=UPI0032EBB3C2
MKNTFDMRLFLSGVLTGSKSTQRRHLHQAIIIQTAIQQRWQLSNPWSWKSKHLNWFMRNHLKHHSDSTRYYYKLTINLIFIRTGQKRPKQDRNARSHQ